MAVQIEIEERDALREGAFTDRPLRVGGQKMRPFSWGSMGLCRKLNLKMFTGSKEERAAVTQDESEFQLATFAWMHIADLDVVLDAAEDGSWRRLVGRYQFTLSPADLPAIVEEVKRISGMVTAASVETVSKGGSAAGESPPPN